METRTIKSIPMSNQTEAREWWLWHFAGLIFAADLKEMVGDDIDYSRSAKRCVEQAWDLIDALEQK